jgi:hypothetical protein
VKQGKDELILALQILAQSLCGGTCQNVTIQLLVVWRQRRRCDLASSRLCISLHNLKNAFRRVILASELASAYYLSASKDSPVAAAWEGTLVHLECRRNALALGCNGLHLAKRGLACLQQPLLLVWAQLQLCLS